MDTTIKKLYVADLPQKSPLCFDELLGGPFSHRKLFCCPVDINNRIKKPETNVVIRHGEIRFGGIAVEKGFITAGQLGKAVSMQMKEDVEGKKLRLIGEILVEMRFMNTSQVNEVLEIQNKKNCNSLAL